MRASAKQTNCLITMECSRSFEGDGSVLINHTLEVPCCVEQFETVCEFVVQQEEILKHARSKFVRYRDRYGNPDFIRLSDWDNRPILNH